MDILIKNFTDYFVIITIKTRYVVLELVSEELTASNFTALRSFFEKLTIKSLESEEKAALLSIILLKYMEKKDDD